MPIRLLILFVSASLFWSVTACAEESPDWHEYFEGLRQRHLYAIAEGACFRRIEDRSLTANEQVLFVEELARTYAAHGEFVSLEEQQQLWSRAETLVSQFLEKHPDVSGSVRLKVQQARLKATRGRFLSWEVRLRPQSDQQQQQCEQLLGEALVQYEAALKDIEFQRSSAGRQLSVESDLLSPGELRELERTTRFEHARTLLLQAELMDGPRARTRNLATAASTLTELERQAITDESRDAAQIELVRVMRLRGEFQRAIEMAREIDARRLSEPLRERLAAEIVRSQMENGQIEDAGELLKNYRLVNAGLPGELSLLRTMRLLGIWELAHQRKRTELAEQIWETIGTHLERTDAEVGGFWAWRSRLLVSSAEESRKYGTQVANLLRKARKKYREGLLNEALSLFDQASDAASTSSAESSSDAAAEIAWTAASIRIGQQNYPDAVLRMTRLAERFPRSERAPEAHLMAAWAVGRIYADKPDAKTRETYTDLLKAHRDTYPNSPTSSEAAWMLGRLEESRLQRSIAISWYRQVAEEHSRRDAAEVAIVRCHEGILNYLAESNRPTDRWSKAASEEIARFLPASEPGKPLSLSEAEIAMRLARIQILYHPISFTAAEKLLSDVLRTRERLLADDPQAIRAAKQTWQPLMRTVMQLQILALAGLGRLEEGEAMISSLQDEDVSVMLQVLDGLVQTADKVDPTTRKRVAQLQLTAANSLKDRRDELTPAQQSWLDRSLGQALIATRNPNAALDVFVDLLKKSPNDPKLIRKVADLQVRCGTKECLLAARKNYKRLEKGFQPGTAAWIDSRFQLANVAFELKDLDEAKRLLRVTRILYPALGGDPWPTRWADLEKRISEAS